MITELSFAVRTNQARRDFAVNRTEEVLRAACAATNRQDFVLVGADGLPQHAGAVLLCVCQR